MKPTVLKVLQIWQFPLFFLLCAVSVKKLKLVCKIVSSVCFLHYLIVSVTYEMKQNELLSSLLETIFLPFIKQISFCTAKINNLWASVSIFFLHSTLFAVICIWNSWAAANNTSSLIWSIVAFITDSNQGAWPYIGITDYTFSITLFTQTTNCNTRLLSTEDQIWMMFSHL